MENKRERGSFTLTRLQPPAAQEIEPLPHSFWEHKLSVRGYYINNHSDLLFHQSAITDNVSSPWTSALFLGLLSM